MKRTALITSALLAAGLLAGCGGGDDEGASTPAAESPAAVSQGTKEQALKVAIENYQNAKFRNDFASASAYLSPKCTDDDRAQIMYGLGMMAEASKGATIKVTGVRVEGDRGTYTTSELVNASDALRRLLKDTSTGPVKMGWVYLDGDWYHEAPCDGETASPEPTS